MSMDTLAVFRGGIGKVSAVLFGTKFVINLSSRHLYFVSARDDDFLKGCIELDDVVCSFDVFCKSPSNIYLFCTTINGNVYAVEANFLLEGHAFSLTENDDDNYILKLHPNEVIKVSSHALVIIACNSENKTLWMVEHTTFSNKSLVCYNIHHDGEKFQLDLLWISNCSYPTPYNCGLSPSLFEIKAYTIFSCSTKEKIFARSGYIPNEKHIVVSDSLFTHMFGSQMNLENQTVIAFCLSSGVVQWFPGSVLASHRFRVNILLDLQEEIVNIHSVPASSMVPGKLQETYKRTSCLLIVGKNGSLVVFGPPEFSRVKINVCCQIESSDVTGHILVFSSCDGVYGINLVDLLKAGSKDGKYHVHPKLLHCCKATVIKLYPNFISQDQTKTAAYLPDGRWVKFVLSTSALKESNISISEKKLENVASLLASIDATMEQQKNISEFCNILSTDFKNLSDATKAFYSFSRTNKLVEHSCAPVVTESCDSTLLKLSLDSKMEIVCSSKEDKIYNIIVILQFPCQIKLQGNSFLLVLSPSTFTKSFSRNIFKLVSLSKSKLISSDARMCKCSISLKCCPSIETLPFSISSFLIFGFQFDNKAPLVVPIDKVEVGLLKFASLSQEQPSGTPCTSVHLEDLFEIMKLKVNNVPSDRRSSNPNVHANHSMSISLSKPCVDCKDLSCRDLWRLMFQGNKEIPDDLLVSDALDVMFLNNIRMEFIHKQAQRILILSCTSLEILSLVHREFVLILHKVGHLTPPRKLYLPVLEMMGLHEPPRKLVKLESDDGDPENLDDINSLEGLLDLYKKCRN